MEKTYGGTHLEGKIKNSILFLISSENGKQF